MSDPLKQGPKIGISYTGNIHKEMIRVQAKESI